jgi:hypothetical protein
MVIHGNDVRQQCIDSFEAGMPLPPVFSGTWRLQQHTNPNSDRFHGLIKAGEDVETWIYPVEIFVADPDGFPYDNITVCINLIYNYGESLEIAKGIANVIKRDNSISTSLSAQGVLQSPDEDVEDIMFNGGFHCVASKNTTEEKCKVSINIH